MKITIDLDTVIFDIEPLYKLAFTECGKKYKRPTEWDITKCYDTDVATRLNELFGDDMLYTLPVIDKQLPKMINKLLQRPDLEVLFVTERKYQQPEKTFNQLRNAGILCDMNQVYDKSGKKSDILKELKPDFHFDDSPFVISGCLEKDVPIVMISNNKTLYNHYLRDMVEYYTSLRQALLGKHIY